MNEQDLHPTVVAFKQFINEHPPLLREIRKSGRSWQEYYEQWIILGESDSHWEKYKEQVAPAEEPESKKSKKDSEILSQLMKYTSSLDMEKMQGQVTQLSKAITSIQGMMEQFKKTQVKETPPLHRDPFRWGRD